jgi:geranylgeranylglycerol-phosphate geranylgeranyltransferase
MTFSLALLLSIGTAVARYQQQRSVSAYNQLICWERLSMGFGVLALLASAPPL